jgi:cellulose synthase/poly-beta-1,6-N-acetylglucosamine synthase-like glycosyltransferase
VILRSIARRPSPAEIFETVQDPPQIALIVCALNEQNVIGQKIENCLELDYLKDRLRILVVSDGSTDATAEVVRRYADRGVELIDNPRRRGKVTNLNEVVPAQKEEIVVLSDANVMYDKRALRHLLAPFADPSVGCTSGKVILVETTEQLQAGEQDYYSVEWGLQHHASRLCSMPGVDGAMHAIRRRLFRVLPADTLIEDFVLAIAVARAGKRVIYQPKAVAWEAGPATLREEFRRKVRIAAGAAQALLRGNGWPMGAPAAFWFVWVSHKLLRWLSPLVAIAVVLLALASWGHPLSVVVLAGCGVLSLAAAIRFVTGLQHFALNAPFYFVFGQVALLTGLVKGCIGRQSVFWAKANR